MENLTHSQQPNMLGKKPFHANPTKTLYDDVFGGPPRFGAPPTLSPRVEDYREIFGGFHAPRGPSSSIPVLDLPAVDNEEDEDVFFDVRSCSSFDYNDVFGGFNCSDFAVSYEDLVRMEQDKFNGCVFSSDEAWTPEDPEYLSEGSDHSIKNQRFSNGDSHESIDGCMEFNISYHKSSQSSNNDMSNGITHITQLLDVPGYAFMVDKTTSLLKTGDEDPPLQVSDDGHLNIDFSGKMMGARQLRKTMSHPANGSIDGPVFANETRAPKEYVRNGSLPNESFVTISNLNLKTRPSQLPPPSRPPPALDVEKRNSGKSTPNCQSVVSEGSAGDSSPPYFDVEVDASSSAAASAAAIKEAMVKAQAKLKTAKELMERKRDGQSRTKSGSKNDRKDKEGSSNKTVDVSGSTKYDGVPGTGERDENGVDFSVLEERQKVKLSDSKDGKRHLNVAKKSDDEKHGRGSLSSQGSGKIDEAGEWKEATQFFELVRTNMPKKADDMANNENILVQNANIHEQGQKAKKASMEALQQQQENGKKIKAVTAHPELVEFEKKPKGSKQAHDRGGNNGRPEAAKLSHREKGLEKKVQAAQEILRCEEDTKKFRMNQPVETEMKHIRADGSEKNENREEIQQRQNRLEVEQTMKDKVREPQPKEVTRNMENERHITRKKEDGEKRQRTFEQEQNEKQLQAALGQLEKERRLKEAFEREEKEKRIKEAREREEYDRKQKEAYQREEDEKRLRVEESERRLKEVLEKEENERRQREALEQEENEKRQRQVREREENGKRLKEALEREEKERRLKETVKQEENDKRQREAREREGNETRLVETLERKDDEQKQGEVYEREESEKKHEKIFGKEGIEKGIKQNLDRETTGNRLEEANEKEENGKLRESQEGEKGEIGSKEACEQEEIWDASQETRTLEETGIKHEDAGKNDELEGLNEMRQDYSVFNQALKLDDREATKVSHEVCKIPQELKIGEKVVETGNGQVDGKTKLSFIDRGKLEHEKNQSRVEVATESACADEGSRKIGEAGNGIEQKNIGKNKRASEDSDIGDHGRGFSQDKGESRKSIPLGQVVLDHEDKGAFMSARALRESVETGRKMAAVQPTSFEVKGSTLRSAQQVNSSQGVEGKVKNLNKVLSVEEKKAERMRREKELELENLRKIEEEREREREREKDRMAVDRAALEACERVRTEARERAERAAVERAMTEARERLEKACAEAREKSLADKTSMEARHRAAATQRATSEPRERPFGKAMSERTSFEARERAERSVSDKFSASSRNSEMGPSSSSSIYNGSYYMERSEGVEGESPQRCKARLERHRRTAERAAKALAEKNMRDLLAQREQAERNRLAETLDADVKRWSSGKEGNLRALLSTLQYILGPESGWQPIPLTEVITSAAVKRAYRKATLCVHPDKLQQRGASIQQKYICEKVFDLLKEAWNRFNSEER